jgi:hypothetical protein
MTASGRAGALWGWKRSLCDLGHKYEMRIDEVTNPLKTFLAQIRAQGLIARTTVQADSPSQARAILDHVYGRENVQNVIQLASMTNETATIKVKSAAELRVANLANAAKNLQRQVKIAKASNAVRSATQRLDKAQKPIKPTV